MKIYTGFGDKGKTRLYGGEVVNKNHPRVEIYGTLDEFNSWLGLIVASEKDKVVREFLIEIQNNIFNISSIIATPGENEQEQLKKKLEEFDYHSIEKFIDRINDKLKPLQNFILPGGSKLSSYYHISRTVCRRAERQMIKLFESNQIDNNELIYINRLSDLLFVLARNANKNENLDDVIWQSKK